MDWKMKMKSPPTSSGSSSSGPTEESSDQNSLSISNCEAPLNTTGNQSEPRNKLKGLDDDSPLIAFSPDSSVSPEMSTSGNEFQARNSEDGDRDGDGDGDDSERKKMITIIKKEVRNDQYINGDNLTTTASRNDIELNDQDDLDYDAVRAPKKRSSENVIEGDEAESKKLKTNYDKDGNYFTAAEMIGFLENQIGYIELRDSAAPSTMKRPLEDLDERDCDPESKKMKKTRIFEYEDDDDDRKLFKFMLAYHQKEGTYPVQNRHHTLNFTLYWIPTDFISPELVEHKIFCLMAKYSKIAQYKRRNPGIQLSSEDQVKFDMYMIWKKNPCY